MAEATEPQKVLVILGSPRPKSNSAALAAAIQKGAEEAGAAVETVRLHALKISPCQACYACQKPDAKGCAIDDDMQTLYPKLIAAPAWVIASPVYWFNMSAQTKLFMDRCFALPAYDKNGFARKKIAVAMSYGDADPFASGCVNALRCFQDAFKYVGAKYVGAVYGHAEQPGEIAQNTDLIDQATRLGRRLV